MLRPKVHSIFTRILIITLAILCAGESCSAVILYSKRTRNQSAPTGSLANSGWQFEGDFGDFLGTAISKKDFITASHIGGKVGDNFFFRGRNYKTVAMFDDPLSDLRVWRVKQTLPGFAPLYTGKSEVGKTAMIIGRGTARGAEVKVNGEIKGWHWKDYDFFQSWGQNVISGFANGPADNDKTVKQQHIAWTFDRKGIANEGVISDGDSGGGVFIKDGSTWKLAGVNHDVDNVFSFPGAPNDTFTAAIFDAGGLIDDAGHPLADTSRDIPAVSVASRISLRSSWISDVINGKISSSSSVQSPGSSGVPEPGSVAMLFVFASALGLCRRRYRDAGDCIASHCDAPRKRGR